MARTSLCPWTSASHPAATAPPWTPPSTRPTAGCYAAATPTPAPTSECSALCRAAYSPTCAANPPNSSPPWTSPATPSAASAWANPSAKCTTPWGSLRRYFQQTPRATLWAWARPKTWWNAWRAASICSTASCPPASPATARSTPARAGSTSPPPATKPLTRP